ncbi:MAG: hypothetical protein QXQ91_03730 [Nanopusillaceae archaeon]
MPTKIYKPSESYLLSIAKIEKPGLRYVLPAVQAISNEVFVNVAYIDVVKSKVPPDVVEHYLEYVVRKLADVSQFGVQVSNAVFRPTRSGVDTEVKLVGKSGEQIFKYLVSAQAPVKFTEDWADSMDLAAKRYARYTQTITAEDWDAIKTTAIRGYEAFIGGSNNPRHQIAALKYIVGIDSIEPEYYLQRIRESVERYKMGYESGKVKFDYKQNIVIAGLAAARKFVEAFALAF